MAARKKWRKASMSGPKDNCVEMDNTREALRDSKFPGVEMPVPGGVSVLVQFIQANRISTPAS